MLNKPLENLLFLMMVYFKAQLPLIGLTVLLQGVHGGKCNYMNADFVFSVYQEEQPKEGHWPFGAKP